MVGRWFFLILGITILQESVAYSPVPKTLEEEWVEFVQRLDDVNYRLPTTTKPSHYAFSLTPYFDIAPIPDQQFTFDGSVAITVEANVEGITEIVMHCKDLTIISAAVETTADDVTRNIIVPESNIVCENGTDFLRLQTTEPLALEQNYTVSFEFRGIIQPGMRGFYRSFYRDSTGRRWMGTTQFQPGHARQAFPCYDEPGFKSHFDITIIRPEDFSPTISNMPIKDTDPVSIPGRVREVFHTTPYTSTYLLAFIVSHYEKITSNNDPLRPFDIYARDNVEGLGDWALEIGEDLLEEMEKLTDFPYYEMQEHLDMKQAAIPDFSAGAMENWGLLTYREALILYDPVNSNHFYKQRVANIVSHEITHMWFGNLVTCAWWDNLWLNEGFARFYQYFLTDAVRPLLGYPTRFITEQLQVAMFSDSEDSAHALTDPSVSDAASVSAHFSTITYARGACILRMTQYLLGKDTYQKGLQAYLKDRQFNVAEPHHLFEALDRAANEDGALAGYGGITIDRYFRSWSEKAGHPLLTVTVDHRTGEMIVVQARWERNTGISSHPSSWDIPITWTRGGDPDFDNLKPSEFITQHATIMNRGTTGYEWVIFNKQESGFYRINYDSNTWILITRALRSPERTVIHEYNRAQIVNDVFSLARAGVLRYESAYNILSFLEYEDQYAPWLAAIDGYSFIRRRLAHDRDNLNKLHESIAELSQTIVDRLGYSEITGESYMDGLLRMYLMEFLCNVDHEGCITAGKQNFERWKAGEFVPANMRPWVYCVGLRTGTAQDFDIFWDRYLVEDLASEQVVMLTAAGCTSDEPSLHKFLSAAIADTDDVRPQDLSTAYNNAVTGNEENTLRVFNWIQANTEAVIEAFDGLRSPLNTIAGRLLNEPDMITFETYLNNNRDIISDSDYDSLIRTVNSARANLRWSDERVGEMAQYFENGYMDEALEDLIDSSEESSEEITGPPPPPPESSESDESDEDGSANIAALSILTMTITLAINYVL